ncbi:MAG: hypothetical protein KGD74_08560, partial [Candidatus Lokiarchaeota archaeon]|nr:hypothetical protein [Candidatus Lokiarchaeota archaeon]
RIQKLKKYKCEALMDKLMDKLYICRSCQYAFPKELSKLIDDKVQVYCEMCGTPFSLSGVEFKKPPTRQRRSDTQPYPKYGTGVKDKNNLEKAIEYLNKFDYIPITFYAITILILSFFNFFTSGGIINVINSYLLVLSIVLILIYDLRCISPRVQSKDYDEIALDAICYGILGSIFYGSGVFLLIKGVLILIYSIISHEGEDHNVYRYGLKLKNSINNFSAKAGFVITLLILSNMIIGGLLSNLFSSMFLFFLGLSFIIVPLIILIIDLALKAKIHKKNEFSGADVIGIFILGAISSAFLSIGIFILIKSLILLLLFIGKPIGAVIEKEVKQFQPKSDTSRKIQPTEEEDVLEKKEKNQKIEDKIVPQEQETVELEPEREHFKEIPEEINLIEETSEKNAEIETLEIEKTEEKKEEASVLRLHESLLPVKNEKDKKIVKEYFSKIFNIISKDLRKQILELNIPKKERKSILKELAFLAEEEQLKYFEALKGLYQEIPHKLIERIRKLPNVKPKYYNKLVEELKYMDSAQQLEFVQYLEKSA